MSERQEALTRTLDLLAELLGADRRDPIDLALATARVRLVVDSADLVDPRTQAAVYTLVSLLVRSGLSLETDLAAVVRRVELPGLKGDDFAEALSAAVPRMFPGARLIAPTETPDVALIVGSAPAPATSEVLRLSAERSRAWVTRGEHAVGRWIPADSLVGLASAGLAAEEVLKDLLRPLATEDNELLDPLEPVFEVPIRVQGPIDLGQLFVISAGAVGQQFVLTMAAVEALSADLVIFDRDTTELSNVNRCPYVMVDDLGRPKVMAFDTQLPERLHLTPVAQHLDDETRALVPPDATIIVGADDIAVRHMAQKLDPAWLGIGATSHFLALVTEHPAGEPCAGCAHTNLGEEIAVIPTWSIVSFWAGFLLALRLIAHGTGDPYPATHQVTNFWPLRPEGTIEHELAFNWRCPVRDHPAVGRPAWRHDARSRS